jgi:hypothetical protein
MEPKASDLSVSLCVPVVRAHPSLLLTAVDRAGRPGESMPRFLHLSSHGLFMINGISTALLMVGYTRLVLHLLCPVTLQSLRCGF